jgi:16S rRNA (guanine527-N7)-methyltransferase
VLLELLLPFVRVGGITVGYKGPAAADELTKANRAARLLGGGEAAALPVAVPGQPDWQHCVLVCRKLLPTLATYPRKAGTPARDPLGG